VDFHSTLHSTLLADIGNMSSHHTKMLEFIDDYRTFTALWDVNNKDYTNKIKRNDALSALATNYEMIIKEVKNKIKSLRSYFAKEHQKVIKKSGEGLDDVYDSPWFAYKSLMFILDSITPRETKETGVEETKKSELEDPGTFEKNNDVSIFYFINILLIMFYIIFINVSLITIFTTKIFILV
jgi:hypothetical protein